MFFCFFLYVDASLEMQRFPKDILACPVGYQKNQGIISAYASNLGRKNTLLLQRIVELQIENECAISASMNGCMPLQDLRVRQTPVAQCAVMAASSI